MHLKAMNSPQDEAELLRRAYALSGRMFGEVAAMLGLPFPPVGRYAKGWTGTLAERYLGACAGSRPEPDLPHLGIEIKSIPIGDHDQATESTFVTTVSYERIAHETWDESRVRTKLARVLWVPYRATSAWEERSFGRPLLWSPDAEEQRVLREDWEYLAGRMGAGFADTVTAYEGQALQVRPKAATSRSRTKAFDAEGVWQEHLPRGFYLRATFTTQVLAKLLASAC